MKALNDVTERGDARYIGTSSMLPAQFAEMQACADKHCWFQFVHTQSCYNLLYREDERDLNIYCEKHNIALTPWPPNQRGILCKPLNGQSVPPNTDVSIARRHFLTYSHMKLRLLIVLKSLPRRGVSPWPISRLHRLSLRMLCQSWV